MSGKRISGSKKAAAVAMKGLGIPTRTVARELGISNGAASIAGRDRTVDPEVVTRCQEQIVGRMVVASDSFLSHSLSRLKELGPYQAMLCSGIAFDKHVQGRLASSRNGSSSILVNVLIAIDQQARSSEPEIITVTSSRLPDVVTGGSKP